MSDNRLIFDKGGANKCGIDLREVCTGPKKEYDLKLSRKSKLDLPNLSEPEVVRHFMSLSGKNYSVDTHFYPLGSCTMKYNPKVNEDIAGMNEFASLHPMCGDSFSQGILEIMYELSGFLSEITGMDYFTLQPAAGAHGELCGMMMVKAYHKKRGETNRNIVIVPDSSHGTNPSSAALYGFKVKEIKSSGGKVDISELKSVLNENCACLMLTNPNTLGIFEEDISKIAKLVHKSGGLLYYDGANLNPLMGICRPGDMGFDIVHVNLHKTFATPHGGGGPGSGPVGVKSYLKEFLPVPIVDKREGNYYLNYGLKNTIGKMKAFYGNISVLLKAYCYILSLGEDGLKKAAVDAVINANYIKAKLEKFTDIASGKYCMHEFVVSLKKYKVSGLTAVDFAKRILDYGFYAPTVSFPLIVSEALMIEPTETESLFVLDNFVESLRKIIAEAEERPEVLKEAPHNLPVGRVDEVRAARFPELAERAAETADVCAVK